MEKWHRGWRRAVRFHQGAVWISFGGFDHAELETAAVGSVSRAGSIFDHQLGIQCDRRLC